MKKQPDRLIDGDKLSTEYHDGVIIKNQANDLHLLVDNQGAFDILTSQIAIGRRKGLNSWRSDIISFSIRSTKKVVKIKKIKLVPTTEQWADFLTKRVRRMLF